MQAGEVIRHVKEELGYLKLDNGVCLPIKPAKKHLMQPQYVQCAQFGFGGVNFHYELDRIKSNEKIEVRLDFESRMDRTSSEALALVKELCARASKFNISNKSSCIRIGIVDCLDKEREVILNEAISLLQRLYDLFEDLLTPHRACLLGGMSSSRAVASSWERSAEDAGLSARSVTLNVSVPVKGDLKGACPSASSRSVWGTSECKGVESFWKDYYSFWDEFLEGWRLSVERGERPRDMVSNIFLPPNATVRNLVVDELPQPYEGFHDGLLRSGEQKLRAIILNLNPGASTSGEHAKFYSKREHGAWLIDEFLHRGSYRKFVEDWSCLRSGFGKTIKGKFAQEEVPGVTWWPSRVKWACRMYGCPDIVSENVFAPEICPYHSKKWRECTTHGGLFKNKDFTEYFQKRILFPVAVALLQNELPFALCVGTAFKEILEQGMGILPSRVWSSKNPVMSWPRKEGRPVERMYGLYEMKFSHEELGSRLGLHAGKWKARLVVTCARGGNAAPGRWFSKVEEEIRQYVESQDTTENGT